ncbi:MAG: hypothetical protein ACFB9N_10895 [Geitlerinemataceae cyanobacterium]
MNSPREISDVPTILIVEDSDRDFYAFLRAFRQIEISQKAPFAFLRFDDGDEVLDYLFREKEYANLDAPYPIAMLLDLNLPGTDGRTILRRVKKDPRLCRLPTIVLRGLLNK